MNQTSVDFAETLFDEVAAEVTAVTQRARMSADPSEQDACSRAVDQLSVLEKRLKDTALIASNENTAELTAFVREFGGDQAEEEWIGLPTGTALGRLGDLHASLETAVDEVLCVPKTLSELIT